VEELMDGRDLIYLSFISDSGMSGLLAKGDVWMKTKMDTQLLFLTIF
jgi:hypothetical protein